MSHWNEMIKSRLSWCLSQMVNHILISYASALQSTILTAHPCIWRTKALICNHGLVVKALLNILANNSIRMYLILSLSLLLIFYVANQLRLNIVSTASTIVTSQKVMFNTKAEVYICTNKYKTRGTRRWRFNRTCFPRLCLYGLFFFFFFFSF